MKIEGIQAISATDGLKYNNFVDELTVHGGNQNHIRSFQDVWVEAKNVLVVTQSEFPEFQSK